jgi:hypothetical protein
LERKASKAAKIASDHSLHEESGQRDEYGEVEESKDWQSDDLPLGDDDDGVVVEEKSFPSLASRCCSESGVRRGCCEHFRSLSRDPEVRVLSSLKRKESECGALGGTIYLRNSVTVAVAVVMWG